MAREYRFHFPSPTQLDKSLVESICIGVQPARQCGLGKFAGGQ
jgi:hypothetical protein